MQVLGRPGSSTLLTATDPGYATRYLAFAGVNSLSRDIHSMKTIVQAFASCIFLAISVSAQTVEVKAQPITDTDIQLLRSDLQAAKNDVIAHTMQFSDAESAAFWPVYRDYTHDQQTIGDARFRVIMDYAQHYGNMSDANANDLTQRFIAVESRLVALRLDYWPKFQKALGAKRAAKFYQVDNRLTLMVNLQSASEIPLVP